MDSKQTHQLNSPRLCANGCGFFGSESNLTLCSKCYRDLRKEEEQQETAKAALEKSTKPNFVNKKGEETADSVGSSTSASDAVAEADLGVKKNRCLSCNKRVGLTGFKCRCGSTFCSSHRYPEKHDCQFDFKAAGRDSIAKANPVVKADKLERF